jgi:hypothetical protein
MEPYQNWVLFDDWAEAEFAARAGPRVVAGSLILASLTDAVAAFRAEAHASLRPWPVLGLWLGSIALLLTGARLLDVVPEHVGYGRQPFWASTMQR